MTKLLTVSLWAFSLVKVAESQNSFTQRGRDSIRLKTAYDKIVRIGSLTEEGSNLEDINILYSSLRELSVRLSWGKLDPEGLRGWDNAYDRNQALMEIGTTWPEYKAFEGVKKKLAKIEKGINDKEVEASKFKFNSQELLRLDLGALMNEIKIPMGMAQEVMRNKGKQIYELALISNASHSIKEGLKEYFSAKAEVEGMLELDSSHNVVSQENSTESVESTLSSQSSLRHFWSVFSGAAAAERDKRDAEMEALAQEMVNNRIEEMLGSQFSTSTMLKWEAFKTRAEIISLENRQLNTPEAELAHLSEDLVILVEETVATQRGPLRSFQEQDIKNLISYLEGGGVGNKMIAIRALLDDVPIKVKSYGRQFAQGVSGSAAYLKDGVVQPARLSLATAGGFLGVVREPIDNYKHSRAWNKTLRLFWD